MSDLKQMAKDLGLSEIQTLLQSGNLVFKGDGGPPEDVEKRLEEEAAKRFSLNVDFVVRTADELRQLIKINPFPAEAKSDPSHLVVLFSKGPVVEESVARLTAAIKGREVARLVEGHLFIHYVDGIGESKLTNSVIEGKLGCRGTARNWNTVLKLREMMSE